MEAPNLINYFTTEIVAYILRNSWTTNVAKNYHFEEHVPFKLPLVHMNP